VREVREGARGARGARGADWKLVAGSWELDAGAIIESGATDTR